MEEKDEEKSTKPNISLFGAHFKGEGDQDQAAREEKTKDNEGAPEDGAKRDSEKAYQNPRIEKHYYYHDRDRRHCGSGIWGLIIIAAGVVLLLNNIGVVPWDVWQYVWPFWPALLVLAGLHVILGHSWFSHLITFVVGLAILAFVIVYALQQVGSPLVSHFPPELLRFVNNFNYLKQ